MKPKVLFVTEKWRDTHPNSPPTNNEHNLFGSLEATGLALQTRFHFDEYYSYHKKPCDEFLIEFVAKTTPDIVVFSFVPWYNYNPTLRTIQILHNHTKLVFIWPDAVFENHLHIAERFEPYSTLSILWDVDIPWRHKSKFVHLWTPQDPRIYLNPRLNRDINVSFVGSVNYNERKSAIDYLVNNGVPVFTYGGQKNRVEVVNYAKILQRSKISLNFCLNGEGLEQLKGRIFESTSCGAMLMESKHKSNWIERWFYPMIHYVPFDSHKDLKDKIEYYLSHDDERNKIAENGWRKMTECYNNVAWWSYVFRESGIEINEEN